MFSFERYVAEMEERARDLGSILCFGLDPVLERIPVDYGKEPEERIPSFFLSIGEVLLEEGLICAVKPNYAFYAQYGFEGLRALKKVIEGFKGKVEVIFDGKRGDIGKTSRAYAEEVFGFWRADALTVSPYVWDEGLRPLVERGFCYLLCLTSNPSAPAFQCQRLADGREIWELIAEKAVELRAGLVVGATTKNFSKASVFDLPMLIPGIGAQGGDLELVLSSIKQNPWKHRINVSSSLAYAYLNLGGSPEQAALAYARTLVEKMRAF